MSTWLIVQKSDLEVVERYEAESKDDSSANRSYLRAEPLCAHIELPEGVEAIYAKCELNGEEYVISHDQNKEDAHVEKMWDLLRTQRNVKLSSCDWTQLDDSQLSAPDKVLWADYRQALRDVPEEVLDPREAIDWPVEP